MAWCGVVYKGSLRTQAGTHFQHCGSCKSLYGFPLFIVKLTAVLTSHLAQKRTAQLMGEIFNIETGFHGTLISAFARLNLDHVVDEVNDETLDPWAELQQKAGISSSTPLTPYMEKELLKDADLSMDGSLFEKETGFK
jgi:hypothetical protein